MSLTQMSEELNNVIYHRDIVNLASQSSDLFNLLKNRYPEFVVSAKSFFQFFTGNPLNFPVIESHAIRQQLRHSDNTFSRLAPVLVYVPSGLDSPYLDLVEALENAIVPVTTIQARVLSPLVDWLGTIVSIDESFTAQTLTSKANELTAKYADVDKLAKGIGKCFSKGSHTKRPYGKVCKRNKDLEETINRLNTLNNTFSRVKPSEMKAQIDLAVQYLDVITQRFSDLRHRADFDEKYGTGFNKGLFRAIADHTYRAAKEIEFFSVYAYYLESTIVAVADTVDHLKKTLRQAA